MRNLESLITEINRILDSVEKPPAGQIARLADWYSIEVQYFNKLVAKILAKDKKESDNANEEFASDEDAIVDLFSFLHFDRLDQWKSFVIRKKLPPLSEIDSAQFDRLKSMISDRNQLSVLLDQYRLIVLAKGPAYARHSLLLRLVHLDSENWSDELEAFEQFRFRELQRQFNQAETDYDKSLMDQAIHEIKIVQWQSTIPDFLLKLVKEKEADNYAEQAEYQLGQLAKQMLLHFEAREWKKANKLKKEWNRLYALTENNAKEKMSHDLNDVLEWADEQNDQSRSSRKTSKIIVICATAALLLAATIGIYKLLY